MKTAYFTWANQINRHTLIADLLAGITGAIIVLPQGVAYALIAGLPPEYGLYTAIVTPIIAALFGSSLHLISGPTAAISIVVLSVVSNITPPSSNEFIPTVLLLTLLVGVIQLTLGLAKLGGLVNFISHTVVIGFTAGAAILIATSQIKYVLDIEIAAGTPFVDIWIAIFNQFALLNSYAVLIALITIATTLIVKKLAPKWPAMLLGMISGSAFCWLVDGKSNGVDLVGALSGSLPEFSIPPLSASMISDILPGALAVAILGLVEAVSIARAIAIRSGQRINGNQEFVGQGLSNITGSFFSCYAGSGSFTRTGINYESGAKTPLAAIFAAIALGLILLFFPSLTEYLPLPAMAGSILLIAYGLIDSHHIKQILQNDRTESAILLVTFISTVIVDLEYAIFLGVITSLALYLRRTSQPRITEVAPLSVAKSTELRNCQRFDLDNCNYIRILRIDGSIFFGSISHIQQHLNSFLAEAASTKHLILEVSGVNFIDLAGVEMLSHEISTIEKAGITVSVSSLKNNVIDELDNHNYLQKLDRKRFYRTVDEILTKAVTQIAEDRCIHCHSRIFRQCPKNPVISKEAPVRLIDPNEG